MFFLLLVANAVHGLYRKKYDPLTFGIVFFLVTISIFSNLFIMISSLMAERFLFFPSVGFAMVVAWLLVKYLVPLGSSPTGFFTQKKLSLSVIGICVIWSLLTTQRNKDWKDNITLYEADYAKCPDNFRLGLFLSGERTNDADNGNYPPLVRMQKYRDIVSLLRRSIGIFPKSYEALAALSDAYMVLEQPDSAIYFGKQAYRYTTFSTQATNALAGAYMQKRQLPEAIVVLRNAMATDHENPEFPGNMGTCYLMTKQYDSAIIYFRLSRQLDPGMARTSMFLALSFKELGQTDSALKYEAEVRRTDPRFRVADMQVP